jgi:leucyl-tRNA---protein transferase
VSSFAASHYPTHPPPLSVPLTVFPEHECSYLPGRKSISRGFLIGQMPGGTYHRFMNAGFRRSGKLLYQPVCRGCRACMSLRVPVETFRVSKSQRRCARRNQDLQITWDEPAVTPEKYELYRRYVTIWHEKNDEEEQSWEGFASFLYDSPVDTIECCYRDAAGRLLAVGICDVCAASLSSVYFYHEPDESRRGLGTFGALCEIEMTGKLGIPHYYLGYWVNGCAAMQYKASFRPCEILHPDGTWRVPDARLGEVAHTPLGNI